MSRWKLCTAVEDCDPSSDSPNTIRQSFVGARSDKAWLQRRVAGVSGRQIHAGWASGLLTERTNGRNKARPSFLGALQSLKCCPDCAL